MSLYYGVTETSNDKKDVKIGVTGNLTQRLRNFKSSTGGKFIMKDRIIGLKIPFETWLKRKLSGAKEKSKFGSEWFTDEILIEEIFRRLKTDKGFIKSMIKEVILDDGVLKRPEDLYDLRNTPKIYLEITIDVLMELEKSGIPKDIIKTRTTSINI